MDRIKPIDQKAGIRFLGEITATLSHDLKNVLAIINENAGLLEDLVFMTTDENPIDPERLATVAGKIRHQVRRADTMIKRLNRVGHSADRSLVSVNLSEMVENICALADRKAAMKGVNVTLLPLPDPLTVKTDPFLLQQVIWHCLGDAIDMAQTSKALDISVQPSPQGATIVFGPMEDGDIVKSDTAHWSQPHLPEALKADISLDRNKRVLTIRLPLDVAM